MMDTVTGIKNNNMKKIPNYDPSELEHLVKLFRLLVHKGHVMETPLKISLADLRMAGERGKWWIVGAAWNKPELPALDKETTGAKNPKLASMTASFSRKLLDLAVKQRMNTDVRKAIFCSIMKAEVRASVRSIDWLIDWWIDRLFDWWMDWLIDGLWILIGDSAHKVESRFRSFRLCFNLVRFHFF